MSERKVLNKYYPPDFDPNKIPRCKLPKNRQYTVRLMAPFNMRCVTCGEVIFTFFLMNFCFCSVFTVLFISISTKERNSMQERKM